jgi:ribosome-associated protein
VKAAGLRPVGIEGQTVGDWILVDLGDLIVHVMMPDARSFYDLERLWQMDAEAAEEAELAQDGR